jgi:hypothetical protein
MEHMKCNQINYNYHIEEDNNIIQDELIPYNTICKGSCCKGR